MDVEQKRDKKLTAKCVSVALQNILAFSREVREFKDQQQHQPTCPRGQGAELIANNRREINSRWKFR